MVSGLSLHVFNASTTEYLYDINYIPWIVYIIVACCVFVYLYICVFVYLFVCLFVYSISGLLRHRHTSI